MDSTSSLMNEAIACRRGFHRGQRLWSFAHHTATFGAVLCSATAGILLNIDPNAYASYAAVLSPLAAVLTAVATAGAFKQKWRRNRISRGRIDGLLLDMKFLPPNIPALTSELKQIIAEHDLDIVSEGKPTGK